MQEQSLTVPHMVLKYQSQHWQECRIYYINPEGDYFAGDSKNQ